MKPKKTSKEVEKKKRIKKNIEKKAPKTLPVNQKEVKESTPTVVTEITSVLESSEIHESLSSSKGADKKINLSSNQGSGGGSNASSLMSGYAREVAQWLNNHKKYPRRALRRGIEGTVIITFAMSKEMGIIDYKVDKSSGSKLLDKATLTLFGENDGFPQLPEGALHKQYVFTIPVVYKIN